MSTQPERQFFPLFAIPVLHATNFIPPEQISALFMQCKEAQVNEHPTFVGNASSNHDSDSDFLSTLGLKEKVQDEIDRATEFLGLSPQNIQNSWFNIQQPGSILKQHIHERSTLSGAIYVNAGDGSKLVFENPNSLAVYTWIGDGVFEIPVSSGDIVILPSWMRHGSFYEENQIVDRTVISFNSR